MAKQKWYAEQGYDKAPGIGGMLQRALPGGRSGWEEPTWWDPDNMSDFTEEDWQKFNEDDPDYAYYNPGFAFAMENFPDDNEYWTREQREMGVPSQGTVYHGESGQRISQAEGIANRKTQYGPITRDRNNDGRLDLEDADPNYQPPAWGETPWWRNQEAVGKLEEAGLEPTSNPYGYRETEGPVNPQRNMQEKYFPPIDAVKGKRSGIPNNLPPQFSLEDWKMNRPPQPNEMSADRRAMYDNQRGNKPILNQAGTFMHGGGTFDDWDYDIPNEVDFDAQVSRNDLMESGTGWGPLNQAAQGRFGDSMMRNVGGEQAHVNPMEAEMIDNYGPAGQRAVKAQGAGTVNPVTGKREYFPIAMALGGAALSAAGGIYAAHKAKKAAKKARKGMKKQMGDVRKFEAMGHEFMDPNSARNQMYLQNMQQQGMDQVALQNQMAQRNAAAYGGGFSGAQAQQAQQAGLQAGLGARQQWLGQMGQQQQTGLGILGSALQQKGQGRGDLSQLRMAGAQAQGEMVSAGLGGAGAGIAGAAVNPNLKGIW